MATELLSAWSTVGSVFLAIFILLCMITVHEFGHYLAGKALGFKIDEFSIGFGPAFVKIRRKKSGELFAVRLLPLGGYCAFHGEDGEEEEEGPQDRNDGAQDPLGGAREAKRGGDEPFAELVGETILVTPPPENFDPAEPAASSDPAENSDSAEPAASSNSAENFASPEKSASAGRPEKRDWNDDGTFTNMKPWKRIVVLVAGAFMNFLLAFVLLVTAFLAYGQTMVAVYRMEEGGKEYGAYSLQDLDIFLQVEGKNLYLTSDLAHALNGKKKGDLVTMKVSRAIGVEWREDEEGELRPAFERREEMEVTVMMRADVAVKNSADFTSVWDALGVKYEPSTEENAGGYYLATAVYRFGFFEGLGRAFVYSFKIAGSIFRILGELFTGKLGLSAFGGPVTTITMTSRIASQGFRSFLEIAGYIGVNLAVFNLLPIPALDGSKVVFTAIEWVRGRPISRKVEAIIHAVGFVLLIGFAILVDVLQFI